MADRLTRRQLLRWTGAGTGVAVGGVGSTAARGRTTSQPAENVLIIRSDGATNRYTHYRLEVQNELVPKRQGGDIAEEEVSTTSDGNSLVSGSVFGPHEDTFYFDGELDVVQFAAEPGLETWINFNEEVYLGADVDVQTLTVGSLIDDSDDSNSLYDYDEFVNYELEVERDLSRSNALVTKTFGDTVDGNIARGYVDNLDAKRHRKRHSYTYRGDLIRFTATGHAGIYLNGRRVHPGELVERHTLTIDGTSGQATPYKFEVESDLRKGAPVGSGINAGDTVDGTVADGAVVDGRDSYEYVGDLLRFKSFGEAQTLLDGRVVDLTPSRLSISGTGDPTLYDFEVRKDIPGVAPGPRKVAPSPAEPADTVDGTEATGVVIDGTDAYEFTGSLARFTADGDFGVQLDGEDIRPREIVDEHTVTYSKGSNAADAAELKYRLDIEDAGTLRFDDALNAKTTQRELDGHVPGGEGVGKLRENFARGAVFGNRDSYVFSGEVTWAVAGDAVAIILDGEPVTAEELAKQ